VLDDSGGLSQFKSPTTPSDPSIGFMDSIEKAAAWFGQPVEAFLGDVDVLVHGTTLATNTLLTSSGAKLGMLTTKEFRDVLELRRGIKPVDVSLYNVFIPPSRPLVPRFRRLEIEERTIYTGEIITPLNEGDVTDAVASLKADGVESIAVCFLHSYANGANELRAAEIARQAAPDIYVTTSHETLPVWREFERFNTTVVGAYVGPAVTRYLDSLQNRLRGSGFGGTLLLMLTNGLVQTIEQCVHRGVYMLNSGPAAAPSGAVYLGDLLGHRDLLSIDMGGTSFDVCVVRNGEIPTTTENWVHDQRIGIKMVDIATLGAGGGSIASIDSLGLLKVGPESAGADPGPACYGRAADPTVTDADLVLGYVPHDYFLGGEMQIDPELSSKAMEIVGKPLGLDRIEAAQAIFATVNSNMADKITEVSTKQGHDIRDCAMVAGGGCGAIHAGFIAEMLGVPIVIIPPVSALYSAFGMFAMDLGQDFARSYVARTANVDPAAMNRLYDAMETEAREGFQAIGVSDAEVKLRRTVELRYLGQFHEVEVEIEGGTVTQATIDAAVEAFSKKHEALYTFSMPWKGTEILTLRLKATTPKAPFHLPAVETGGDDPGAALKRERRCRFGDRYIDTPVYDGAGLRADNVIQGPAIIEEPTTTVVIPENFKCTVDGFRNYVLTRRDGGEEQNDE
jgi:N-methylhydantoinase A